MIHRTFIITIMIAVVMASPEAGAQTLDQQVNLFTIPNMSTSFVRMPSRESSQEIDAVFFNPAGLTGLEDGVHVQVNNQFQFVRKGSDSRYAAFNDNVSHYDFNVTNLTFPTAFAAWKRNNLAFSLGIHAAMGGGGGAGFKNLPSAELPIADMNNALRGLLRIYDNYYQFDTRYSRIRYEYDFNSTGLAFSPGVQLTASYKINESFSVAAGVRYVTYISNAEGYASDISVTNEDIGVTEDPAGYLRYLAETENDVIAARDLNVGPVALDGEELLYTLADIFEALIPESDIDVKQRGKGFTPIIGVQYKWNDKVFVVAKYEHKTKIELTTTVNDGKDGDGLYEDGKISRGDLPGFLSLGLRYQTGKWIIAGGHRAIFYKRADWNGREEFVERNFVEFTASAEYRLHPKISVSGGYTYSQAIVEDEYQNEVDYVLPGHTFAFGAKWFISDKVALEAGLLNTIYNRQEWTKMYEPFAGRLDLPEFLNQEVRSTADGRVMLLSIGASISLPESLN